MTIYVLIMMPNPNNGRLKGALEDRFPSRHRQISSDAWLVAGKGSAKAISDALGISDGSNGSAVIVEVESYFGRASKDIWDWIKDKWEATDE